jgi:hypothetical protein
MKYEWEDAVIKAIKEAFEAMDPILADEFSIIGVAVGHEELGEGCYVPLRDQEVGPVAIWDADVLQDVKGDLTSLYEGAVAAMFEPDPKG